MEFKFDKEGQFLVTGPNYSGGPFETKDQAEAYKTWLENHSKNSGYSVHPKDKLPPQEPSVVTMPSLDGKGTITFDPDSKKELKSVS